MHEYSDGAVDKMQIPVTTRLTGSEAICCG